jgi:hypothetical protein
VILIPFRLNQAGPLPLPCEVATETDPENCTLNTDDTDIEEQEELQAVPNQAQDTVHTSLMEA